MKLRESGIQKMLLPPSHLIKEAALFRYWIKYSWNYPIRVNGEEIFRNRSFKCKFSQPLLSSGEQLWCCIWNAFCFNATRLHLSAPVLSSWIGLRALHVFHSANFLSGIGGRDLSELTSQIAPAARRETGALV